MSLAWTHGIDSLLLVYILEPAARALAVAGAVWLLLAAFRLRDVGFRLAAWTAVLYAALAMPLLGRVMPTLPVLLPEIGTARAATVPAAAKAQPAVRMETAVASGDTSITPAMHFARETASSPEAIEMSASASTAAPSNSDTISAAPDGASSAGPRAESVSWTTIATIFYGLIAGLLLGRLGLGLLLSQRIEREAEPVEDERLARLLEREARRIGLSRTPRVMESAALSVPAAMGALRPVVLLPRSWGEWPDAQIEAVLAHELSHIARRDPLTQLVSRVYRAIFWFSPLGWWLDRTLVELAEQASDDAALRAGADRTHYAEVLLNFFRALGTTRRRVRWQAVSMAQGARSTRRLERILSGSSTSMRLGRAAVAAVALTLLPLACLAAAVEPSFTAQTQIPAPPPPMAPPAPPAIALVKPLPAPVAAPLPTPAPGPAAVPAPAPIPKVPTGEIAPLAKVPNTPATPALPAPRPAPRAPMLWFAVQAKPAANGNQASRQENESWYSSGNCSDGEALVIVSGGRTISECGSASDLAQVEALRQKIRGNFLWFRRNGRSYVIRDAATVNAAIDAFAPERALAREQQRLGREQAALGRKQAELGMRQAQVRIDMPDFSAAMKQMEAALSQIDSGAIRKSIERARKQMKAAFQKLDSKATQEELGHAQAQLDAAVQSINSSVTEQAMAQVASQMAAMQSRLGALQAEAGKKQAALGRKQAELGRRQAELGQRQEKLGLQQQKLARKAAHELRHLVDHALAKGLAKPQ